MVSGVVKPSGGCNYNVGLAHRRGGGGAEEEAGGGYKEDYENICAA